ncbi:MAG TPA: hypothetical protein VK324_14195, partial [Tepidisphaeraceae bacterium]|nr:hypothetical protein [Tepidisphaeraceae bacterium]
MPHRPSRSAAAFVIVSALAATASPAADELFGVTAVGTNGETVRVTGSSLVDLVEDLVESEDQFRQLEDAGFTGNLTYAGIRNAVQVSRNAEKTRATLRVPSIGLTKTFTGTNEDELDDEIEDYILREGASEWGQFLAQVNRRTTVGVTDGNPLATTAVLSDSTYARFGLRPSPIGAGNVVRLSNGGEFRVDLAGGQATADAGGDGTFAAVTLSTMFRFTDWLGLS